MNKKIIFCALLVLFLISAIGAVSSADIAGNVWNADLDNSVDLSSSNLETHSASSEAISNDEILGTDSYESEILESNTPKPSKNDDPILGQQQQQQQEPEPACKNTNSSIIVNKIWEGNDSGNITSIQIQLLHKVIVQSSCPPKWKSTPDDAIFNETVGTVVFLPDANGVMTSYTIVEVATISKENNWRHVFKNLTFISASKRDASDGSKYWYLGDTGEYVVREIGLPENVEAISAIFVRNFTCPLDGGLKVFWNLTNRYIPPSNETNQTNETVNNTTNETNPFENETDDIIEYNDYARGPSPVSESNNTQEDKESENVSVDKNATGNPLFILFIMISILILPILRRKG